jgi:hypothetical protein
MTSTALRPFAPLGARIRAHPAATRWILAGPVAILVAVVTMMAMPIWVPGGRAGIDDIALPILLAPLLWAIPFLYACLAEDLVRCAAVLGVATLAQGALVAAWIAA